MISRREWLSSVSAAAALTMLDVSSPWPVGGISHRSKRILVLGGTSFLGPAVVNAALAAGHTVTLFNRGVTNPGLFPELEHLRGYRDVDPKEEYFSPLDGRQWDAVIDVWPFEPSMVETAVRRLHDRTSHYLYVSSIAAYPYASLDKPRVGEDTPLLAWDPSIAGYNRGKAESERRLRAALGDRVTVVRPGAIKGDRDTALDLFTWLHRMRQAGSHIGPGTGKDYFQFVDVRDVARFLVSSVDVGRFGTFNLAGEALTFSAFIAACGRSAERPPEVVWIDGAYLHRFGLDPASGADGPFPDWHPNRPPGFYQISSVRAQSAGWRPRPFEETAQDCLAFVAGHDPGFASWVDPLSAQREREVIAAWNSRSGDGSA